MRQTKIRREWERELIKDKLGIDGVSESPVELESVAAQDSRLCDFSLVLSCLRSRKIIFFPKKTVVMIQS